MSSASLPPEELEDLNLSWHRLKPWPDLGEGLSRLKSRFIIAPLSDGHARLLVNVSKFNNLPWDFIVGADMSQAYKPMPQVYLRACELLEVQPENAMLVAAHDYDLEAARRCGLKTAYIVRATGRLGLQSEEPARTRRRAPIATQHASSKLAVPAEAHRSFDKPVLLPPQRTPDAARRHFRHLCRAWKRPTDLNARRKAAIRGSPSGGRVTLHRSDLPSMPEKGLIVKSLTAQSHSRRRPSSLSTRSCGTSMLTASCSDIPSTKRNITRMTPPWVTQTVWRSSASNHGFTRSSSI